MLPMPKQEAPQTYIGMEEWRLNNLSASEDLLLTEYRSYKNRSKGEKKAKFEVGRVLERAMAIEKNTVEHKHRLAQGEKPKRRKPSMLLGKKC